MFFKLIFIQIKLNKSNMMGTVGSSNCFSFSVGVSRTFKQNPLSSDNLAKIQADR